MTMGYCERCGAEREGQSCPVCGDPLLPEITPETLESQASVWFVPPPGGESGPSWPVDAGGEPEEPVLLTELVDVGGRHQLLQSRLRAYSIPSLIRYPDGGGLGKIVLGFSGYGVQVFVPASRMEEACRLLDLF